MNKTYIRSRLVPVSLRISLFFPWNSLCISRAREEGEGSEETEAREGGSRCSPISIWCLTMKLLPVLPAVAVALAGVANILDHARMTSGSGRSGRREGVRVGG